jgi:alpha-beta hydrolase superfamily lysophospholipase
VIVLHGVQSHEGWYPGLGERLAEAGYVAVFPDRRGSGANQQDRGHADTGTRLILDVAELAQELRGEHLGLPLALAGISWGGKLVVVTAARYPKLVDALALICPGLKPRVGVSFKERLAILLAFLTNRRKRFPIPLSDPALFTSNPDKRTFIAEDPLSIREGTASLMLASHWIDRWVKRIPQDVHQPVLLMLAEHDRIVDNAQTRAYFESLASPDKQLIEYPGAHHTLEFEPDPSRYARDLIAWLDRVLKTEATVAT